MKNRSQTVTIFFPLVGRMIGVGEWVRSGPAKLIPKEVDGLHRPAQISEIALFKGRDLGWIESVFPGSGKKIVFILGIQAGQLDQEVFEIDADTRFLPEKGADVKPDAHFV
jgi:hypothetical protein